ncbi:hypothetical protein HY251_01360 [bacterium]|nr:hypothetical protein [bacterium]
MGCDKEFTLETWGLCGGHAVCRPCHDSLKAIFQHRCLVPAGGLVRRA